MNEAFYHQTSRIEERHWWFRARRALADRLLRSEGSAATSGRGLDVGCGSGGNLSLLARHCADVVGLERSALALDLARAKHPGARLVRGDANHAGSLFREESFAVITVFNVLYHRWIDAESAVLEQLAALLRPGGLLLVTEPAFPVLFRRHDAVDHGVRRYRAGELADLVRAAGLQVRRASYFNSVAFLPALLVAGVDRLRGRGVAAEHADSAEVAELGVPVAPLNRSLEALLGVEARWIERVGRVPVGVGVLVLARRAA